MTKKETAVAVEPAESHGRSVAVPNTAPKGFENIQDTKDFILPRVELLQPTSPAVIDGLGKPGAFMNNLTKEALASNVIIPIFVQKNFIKWTPYGEGGGMIYRTSDPKDPRVVEDTKWNGTEKPTCTQYLNFLCLIEGEETPIVVSFHDTGYQAGRDLLTIAKLSQQDMWAFRYELTSLKVEGDKGTFFKFKVRKLGPSSVEQRAAADMFYNELFAKDLVFDQEQKGAESAGDPTGDTTTEF